LSFAAKYKPPAAPREDVLVWELEIPAETEGAVVALCDGYEGKLQLRSKMGHGPGAFAAWVAPPYRAEIEGLLADLARRYGVRVAGPRPFAEADLGEGMHLAPRRADRENDGDFST
jgi:hypothetical protein